jgi:large subunit ribosomal protein L9
LISGGFTGGRRPDVFEEETPMEIILTQDVDELGLEGDIVDVAKGYARNFLLPKGMGLEANQKNIRTLQQQRKKIEVRRLKAQKEALELKERLEGMAITFSHKAGEEGKLYGSVTRMDIASSLEKEGIVVDRKKILLERPVKTLGEFNVPIRIYPEVTGSVRVVVIPEKDKNEPE